MGLPVRSILVSGATLFLFMLVLVVYILGAARHLADFEENTCQMTYMFEYPQYVRITLDHEVEKNYPRYGLYAYGEGYVTEKTRRMHFSGIPVLFVPGNAGSHEQVRSLASVSLRKSIKDRTPFHFDFFAVSFGKDYSGLYGGVLMEETYYVAQSIQKILSLYKGSMNSVILIGHSMGGLIAKGSLLLTPFLNASSASMILNLATPHSPMLVLDSKFAAYYESLEQQLGQLRETGPVIVSIAGGPRDILVTSGQTIDRDADINVVATSIPDVWRSVDHLSILWCKQLVLAVVRALFDSVDYSKRPATIFQNRSDRLRALEYHLHRRPSGKRMQFYKEKFYFESDGEWIEDIRKQYAWTNHPRKTSSSVYLMIRLSEQSHHLTVETVNLEAKDWLFVCTASKVSGFSRFCEWGYNLTNKTRISPDPMHRLRKSVDLDLREIQYPGATHLIVRVPPEDLTSQVFVNVDIYSLSSRTISVEGNFPILGRKPAAVHTDAGAVRLYAELRDIESVVTAELQFEECGMQNHFAVAELLEPIYAEATQTQFFTAVDNGPKKLKLQVNPKYSKSSASLRLTLDPACRFKITLQEGGLIDRIASIVRDNWPLLHTTVASLLFLLLSMRVEQGRDQTPGIVVTVCLTIYYGLMFEWCVSLALLAVLSIGVCCAVIFLGSVAHSIAVRFLARAVTFSTTWSDWLLGALNQLPYVTTVLVLSVIPVTCGALAMLISVFISFLNLTNMYEDYLEELLMASLEHFSWASRFRSSSKNGSSVDTRRKIINQLLLFLFYCLAAINAVPSVLVWAKNFGYDITFTTEDSALLKSWLVLVACSTSGLLEIPTRHQGLRSELFANLFRLISWIVLSMGAAERPTFYQYLMPPTIAGVASLIVFNHILP